MNNEEKRHQVKHFINKFERIDEQKWCVDTFDNDRGQRCARGHTFPDNLTFTGIITLIQTDAPEAKEDALLCELCPGIAGINNGQSLRYPQPTPKQRVLAALRDLISL